MSKLILDWLVSGQSLPIEGVGLLHWERTPVQQQADGSVWAMPHWVLSFDEASDQPRSADFFNRLRGFSGQSAQAVEAQYDQWLQLFQKGSSNIDLSGLGVFVKEEKKWRWNATASTNPSTIQLAPLPTRNLRTAKSFDWPAKLLLLFTLAAIGWLTWQGFNRGVHSTDTRSRISTPVSESTDETWLYREVR